MSDFCCNPIYPNLMREFISNFTIDNWVCSSVVKEIKIEFNSLMLREWFGVPIVGLTHIMLGLRLCFQALMRKQF